MTGGSGSHGKADGQRTCSVCGKSFAPRDIVSGATLHHGALDPIRKEHPEIGADSWICRADLNRMRGDFVHGMLESEKGELTALEHAVVKSLRDQELLARNVDVERPEEWSYGERLADKIAAFGGSWTFLICFAAFIGAWIGLNTFVLVSPPPDPYPYILLNLLLSCLAAIQAPIIMMSQRRQEAKDRRRSEHDYQVNLKAELEIRHLHDKVDHLLSHQWERLVAIQQVQLDLLSEISKKK